MRTLKRRSQNAENQATGSPLSAGAVCRVTLQEARQAGLLDDKTDHVSFRAPRALIEAAKKETGLQSTTELGLVALAMLARPDPVAQVLRRSRGDSRTVSHR
jgi:hypothetical protein